MTDLGNGPFNQADYIYFSIYAQGMNNRGQVVGTAHTPGGSLGPFVWRSGSGMEDLNTLIAPSSGWNIWNANAINDKGQIVGRAYSTTVGNAHAILLSPLSTITVTTGAPPNTLSNALKPVNTTTTPPSGRLKRWNGQSWDTVNTWTNNRIDPNQPTVVLAHGWYGHIDGTKTTSGICTTMMSTLADALQQQNQNANILGWDWSDEAVSWKHLPNLGILGDIVSTGLAGADASARRGAFDPGLFTSGAVLALRTILFSRTDSHFASLIPPHPIGEAADMAKNADSAAKNRLFPC